MNKNHVIAGIAVVAILILSGSTSADTYAFKDMIDTWTPSGRPGGPFDSVWTGQHRGKNRPLIYSHDINDDVDFLAGHYVTSATLELNFIDADLFEEGDKSGRYRISYDFREYAKVYLEYDAGSGDYIKVEDLGEIGNGQYDMALAVDWLNIDGILGIKIQVSNPLGTGNISLSHSLLYGTACSPDPVSLPGSGPVPVPVPGAVLLGVLGLGAAGLKLRRGV